MTRLPLRAAAALAALALASALFAACMGDTRPRILIEWGAYPEQFEGLTVEIDGKAAGTLKKFGEATRTAFLVEKGQHRVRVAHATLGAAETEVAAEFAGQRVMLLLEVGEGGPGGSALTFRR